MALTTCPECGNQVSDKAAVCIHCGYPLSNEQLSENTPVTIDEPKSNCCAMTQTAVVTNNFPKRLEQPTRQARFNGGIAVGIYFALIGLITMLTFLFGYGSLPFRAFLILIPYFLFSYIGFYNGIKAPNKKLHLWKKFFVVALCVLFAIPPISFATLVAGVLTPQCGFFIFILLVLGGLLLLISIILCVITKTKVPKAHIEDTIQQ